MILHIVSIARRLVEDYGLFLYHEVMLLSSYVDHANEAMCILCHFCSCLEWNCGHKHSIDIIIQTLLNYSEKV